MQALGFADDFVLLESDEQVMKNKIDFLDRYCKNKLNLNIEQSKIILIHKGRIKKYSFKYRGQDVEILKSIKNLGIEFSNLP